MTLLSCPDESCEGHEKLSSPLKEIYPLALGSHSSQAGGACTLSCPHCRLFVFPCENCFGLVRDIFNSPLEGASDWIACGWCGFLNVFPLPLRKALGKPFSLSPVPYSITRLLQCIIANKQGYVRYLNEEIRRQSSQTEWQASQETPVHTPSRASMEDQSILTDLNLSTPRPPRGGGKNLQRAQSSVITNTQGPIEHTPSPSTPISTRQQALLEVYRSHLDQLEDTGTSQEDESRLAMIQEIEIPLFSPTHFTMLRALYNEEIHQDSPLAKVFSNAQDFLRDRKSIEKLKKDADHAQKVYETFLRFPDQSIDENDHISMGLTGTINRNEGRPLNAHQIMSNLLSYRALRLDYILRSHTQKYMKTLERINAHLIDLYNQLQRLVKRQIALLRNIANSPRQQTSELELLYELSSYQQRIGLWRLLYRSVSLLIT